MAQNSSNDDEDMSDISVFMDKASDHIGLAAHSLRQCPGIYLFIYRFPQEVEINCAEI